DHTDVNYISMDADKDTDSVSIKWSSGSFVKLRSGELKGLLDLYNGNGEDNTYRGIPYYQRKLNDFAYGFAEAFNAQHRKGFGLDGAAIDPQVFDAEGNRIGGINFFDYHPDNPAATITLSDLIMEDLAYIAAAQSESGSAEDNRNLLELIKLRENGNFFDGSLGIKGTPDDFLKSIISNLAVDSMQGIRMYDTQNLILKNIESKRDSISGVSYDEEMADMVRFQHTYVASARMISTLDAIMDVTINRLGLVGR
ncbi:MAG: flagellar hook-associated protein FlgK, partial [Tissierellia bacterium]|nr:flagellar hook-associated protein FlgK [Tissierellia bacterium]